MLEVIRSHRTLALGLIIAIITLVMVLFLWSFIPQSPITNQPSLALPTPILVNGAARIPGLQKTSIGNTTTEDVLKIPNVIQVNDSEYAYPSELITRSNKISTSKDVVIFERVEVPVDPSDPKHKTIEQMITVFGDPDNILPGSNYFGNFVSTYIYASKGMAFVGNPNTSEIYEMLFFKPTSVSEYLNKYGEDIPSNPSPITESH
jgi:hypothetical protein